MDLAKSSLAGKAMARPDLVRQVLRTAKRDGVRATAAKVFAKLDQPIPLGYSLAGTVLEVGRDVSGFMPGDRVACAGAAMANHAEINAVPKNLCARIPDGVSDEQASFVTLGAIALQGVRQATPTLGERFVVMGLGLIGLLTVQLLKANGCQVLGFDPNAERAELAKELGADVAVSTGFEDAVATFTRGVGADAVVLTASTKSSDPLNQAGEISRLKGRVVVVGLVGMTLERDVFYKRELDLKLSMSYGPGRHDPDYELAGHDYPLSYVRWTEQRNMEAFLQLVAEGRVTPERLVTHRFSIAEAEDAYEFMGQGKPHLAIILEYPEQPKEPIRREFQKKVAQATGGIGFVGLGNYAKAMLLPALKGLDGMTLTRVATSTGLSADNAGEKYGFASVATDPETIFEADDTDTIFIATRHDSHANYTQRALEAGKNVFVEKPLALTLEELDQVIATAEASPGLLTVGFNRRFAPMIRDAKAALNKAAGPKLMLYRVNAGEIPSDSWIQRGEGGGRIVGEVCHFVDTLAHLAGSLPIEAQAMALRDRDDAVSILLRFADGSTGTILYSSVGDPAVPKEYLEVFSAGTVVQMEDFTRLTITTGGKATTTKGNQDKGQKTMVKAFFEATRTGGSAPIPLAELVAVTEATFAIEEALRQGGTVSFATV
ncbi:bi-domain-containing oxidoreductase [Roseovarius sp. TE539]|uniref:bi-domain-containing oxidoreductase n=1 Tax=Roseovarius sp. TE539 TaxID=2249812 RepID=UPI00215C489E|nr:bi-domain-containing oxidoreductase [Roseovarius sp. TE539]